MVLHSTNNITVLCFCYFMHSYLCPFISSFSLVVWLPFSAGSLASSMLGYLASYLLACLLLWLPEFTVSSVYRTFQYSQDKYKRKRGRIHREILLQVIPVTTFLLSIIIFTYIGLYSVYIGFHLERLYHQGEPTCHITTDIILTIGTVIICIFSSQAQRNTFLSYTGNI